MMLNKNDSHSEFAWDFEAYWAWVCKIFLLIAKNLKVDSICSVLTEKEIQMCITKVEELEIGREDMGGDLNRLELTKIENFKDRMAT